MDIDVGDGRDDEQFFMVRDVMMVIMVDNADDD